MLTKKTPARDLPEIAELRVLGSDVEIITADVSDRDAMRAVLDATREKFGALHGVIHAAGIVRAGMALTKTRAVAESVLAPKVAGTWVLHELLAGAELDFLVLFSSITAITTPFAECDYSGANAFLDAYAHFVSSQRPYPVLSINWPGWREVGQLVNLQPLPGTEAWKEAALRKAIGTEQGVEAFRRALAAGLPQVIVSPTDLDAEIRDAALPIVAPPPRVTKPAAAASTSAEETVIAVWQHVLGIENIGPEDSFFELGGHSLLLMQVHRELTRRLGRPLTMLTLLEHPTPRALAPYLSEGAPPSAGVDQARQRAVRARQAMATRAGTIPATPSPSHARI